ncbi:uncharacterized protein [Halyomorpha halys]|uniref:uncharacterized protein n=1 Tax=Halyomorpha halys TaxID=286706 RepID=UPI0006D4F573|nr:COPII coat assembly protein sec16-like [Halyomorpha halys]
MSHSQQVGIRICKFELSGESNIYVCPRDEYCCNIGCCISPTFQFYQLWYYWFMVFFMFLVCSGGQWWYRYVMQGRCASAIAPPARRASYPRQARVAYTPARDTVVLHHLWKPSYTGPGMNGPPPSYSQSGSSSSSGCSLVGPKPSPYMQLYGPPPSYESVIASGPAPAPVHNPQVDGGPSQNHTTVQQGRSSASYNLQPLELHHVNPNLAQQQSSSHNQPLTQQHLSSLTLHPPSHAQPEGAHHLHQNAVGPTLPGPQQASSSTMNPSQLP